MTKEIESSISHQTFLTFLVTFYTRSSFCWNSYIFLENSWSILQQKIEQNFLIYPAVAQYQETNYQDKNWVENENNGYMYGFLGLAGPLTSVIKDLAGQKTWNAKIITRAIYQ